MGQPEKSIKRLEFIDDIRGISIIVMILIHTNAYHLGNKIAFNTLEISQFAVAAFIFCSSYLFFQKDREFSIKLYWGYFTKRLNRLVLPYYGFLVGLLALMLFAEPRKINFKYLAGNLLLTGGSENNWLVLLFLELSLLMPLFALWRGKNKPLLILYTALASISSIIFLKFTPLPYFRPIMWLPWSLIVVYTMLFGKIRQNKILFWLLTLGFLAAFLITREGVLIPLGKSLRMYSNKYPPNLYHISYSLFCLNVLYVLSEKNVFAHMRTIIHFFSKYSYTIYFIHTLIIYVLAVILKLRFDWVGMFVVVIGLTTLVQLLVNWTSKKQVA